MRAPVRGPGLQGLSGWVWPWLALVCGAVLALGCSDPAPPKALGQTASLEQARELADQLMARRQRGLALCGLAAKAAASAPDLARELYQEAWQQMQALAEPKAPVLAQELRQQAEEGPAPARRAALELAARLEDHGRRAWPLRVLAEGAQALLPQMAAQALEQGLGLARQNPDLAARAQDLAGLSLVLARRDPPAGRALANQLGDPLWRAWVLRDLAVLEGGPSAWEQAAQAARQLPQGSARALGLARTALAGFEADPALGLTLFEEAFLEAGLLVQPRQRTLVQGQVAAWLAKVDAESGWRLAKRAEPLAGARFLACRAAGLALMASDPAQGRRALFEAWEAARGLELEYERQRAAGLLIQDLAGLDPGLARELLAGLPPGENLLRGQAEAAMVLAEASQDWPAALAKAQRLEDQPSRLKVLIRLAAAAQPRQAGQDLLTPALALARQLGDSQALSALARQVAAEDARKGVDIAAGIGENVARATALSELARALAQDGQTAASQWALTLAQESLQELNSGQALDKAGLLGDMGQEWAAVDAEVSRRFFKMGAEAARKVGQTS